MKNEHDEHYEIMNITKMLRNTTKHNHEKNEHAEQVENEQKQEC